MLDYRTYPEYVQDEVTRHLRSKANYLKGPSFNTPFVVEDGQLPTARWPKDAELFAETFIQRYRAGRFFLPFTKVNGISLLTEVI